MRLGATNELPGRLLMRDGVWLPVEAERAEWKATHEHRGER